MGRQMSVVKRCTPYTTIRKFSCNFLNGKDCCQNSPVYKITESFSERIYCKNICLRSRQCFSGGACREISVTRPSGLLEPHAQKQRHNCEAVGNQSHEKKQLQL